MCRELTKRFEEVVRGSAAEVAARFAEPPKGEITLVLGAGRRRSADIGCGGRGGLRARRRRAAAPAGGRRRRASDGRVAQRALPPYFVASIDNRDAPCYGRSVLKTGNKEGNPCGDFVSCCAVRARAARVGGKRLDAGRSTGRFCGRSRSTMRTPTRRGQHRGVDLGAAGGRQVLAPAGGIVTLRRDRADRRQDRLDRDAARLHGDARASRVDRRDARSAASARARSSGPSARAASPTSPSRSSTSGRAPTSDAGLRRSAARSCRSRDAPSRRAAGGRGAAWPPPAADPAAAEPVVAATTRSPPSRSCASAWCAQTPPVAERRSSRLSARASRRPSRASTAKAAGCVATARCSSAGRADSVLRLGAAESATPLVSTARVAHGPPR